MCPFMFGQIFVFNLQLYTWYFIYPVFTRIETEKGKGAFEESEFSNLENWLLNSHYVTLDLLLITIKLAAHTF